MEPQNSQPTNTTIDTTLSPSVPTPPKPFPWLIVIFATLFITTLIAGTFFFLRMQSLQKQLTFAPSPTPTLSASHSPSTDPTADWQIYSNPKALFTFRYPNSITITAECIENPNCMESFLTIGKTMIYQYQNSDCENIKSASWSDPVTKSSIKVDGIDSLFISSDNLHFNDNEPHYLRSVCIPLSNKSIKIQYSALVSENSLDQFDQILSTFRFTDTTSSTDPNTVTFASNKLGITFQYQRQNKDTKEQVAAKEIGNKVYVYPSTQELESGQYVEIFSKSENDSLNTAISNSILSGYSSDNCMIKSNGISLKNLPSSYQVATITLPPAAYEIEPEQSDTMAAKCPQKYLNFRGISYFVSDNLHPTKFAFFSIGQYAISGSSDKDTWQDTFRFTDQ